MDMTLPPLVVSSGFLPVGPLLESLIHISNEVASIEKFPVVTVLFNLAVYNVNKASVVVSGAIPLLIDLLMDDKAGITDDALAVLALLLGCSEAFGGKFQ